MLFGKFDGIIGPGEYTPIRIIVLQISQIDVLSEHAIILLAVTKDIIALSISRTILFIEVLKAKIVVIVRGPSDQGLFNDHTQLTHLQNYLVTDVVHNLANGVRNHTLQNFWLSSKLIRPG